MLTLRLTAAAAAQALEPCATPWLMPSLYGVVAEPLPPPPPATGKALRNTYDGIPNVATSENFARRGRRRGGADRCQVCPLAHPTGCAEPGRT